MKLYEIPEIADKRCKECFSLNSTKRKQCVNCKSIWFQDIFRGLKTIPPEQDFNQPRKKKKGWQHKLY